ncbi:MAG: calcium-binding protein [Aestuariivirga sp.]
MPTRKWGAEKLVNTGLTGDQLNSSIAGLTGGGYVVVWQDDSTVDSAIRAQRFDAQGNKAGAEIEIIEQPGNGSSLPSVAGLADGGFYVNWTFDVTTDNYILGSVYDANGAFVRVQNVVFPIGFDRDTSTARLGTGSVVAWRDPEANSGDLLFRVFDAAGNAGAVLTANTSTVGVQNDPSVAATPDGSAFAIVWYDFEADDAIRGRAFNAAGAELLPQFTVELDDNNLINLEGRPQVTWLNNGQFVVVWTVSELNGLLTQVRAKIFGASGTAVPITDTIHVNSTTVSDQRAPVVVALATGGFAVAWQDSSGVGGDGNAAIRLQAFDGAGGKIGGEILVNTTTAGDQLDPSIAALADGRVVVSWTDFSSGTADIRTQIVDPRDGIVTGTANADTLYGHDAFGDEINGGLGGDSAFGLAGNDQIYGGQGNDIADGGKGDDALFGGADNDTLLGGLGDDDLYGEDGNDTLRGGAGADLLDGGAGTADMADYIAAAAGVTAALDASLAGAGEALGDTFSGIERIRGSNFIDTLRGDAGANILFGQTGADTMDGRAGGDRLIGGLGIDTLTGGTQADRFEFAALTEIGDIITDFNAVDDTIVVTGAAFGGGLVAGTLGAALLQSSATNVAANATVRFIFENDVKILWFDADGNGAGAAVMVADLQASATMTNADILIV